MFLSDRVYGCLFMVLWIPRWFSSLKTEEMDVCNQAFFISTAAFVYILFRAFATGEA